jgi:hypothetical protein
MMTVKGAQAALAEDRMDNDRRAKSVSAVPRTRTSEAEAAYQDALARANATYDQAARDRHEILPKVEEWADERVSLNDQRKREIDESREEAFAAHRAFLAELDEIRARSLAMDDDRS